MRGRVEQGDRDVGSSGRMGTEPLKDLLIKLSLPAMLGMFIQSTYNVVDTMFVGRLGVEAITALSVVFPIQIVLIALGLGTSIGVASLISRLLGKGDREKAAVVANNAIAISLLYWLITGVVGYFFSSRIIGLFINEKAVVEMGSEYLEIIMLFSGTMFFFIIAERILHAQGNTLFPTIVLASTAVLNIILDPVFIYGFWFVPSLGVKGAAVATVISRAVGCVAILFVLLSRKNELPLSIRKFRLKARLMKRIFDVGGPVIAVQLLGSIMLAIVNIILGNISVTAVAVLGIFFKVQSFIMMPIYGLVHGFSPLVGYNFGARKWERVREVLVIGMKWSFCISLAGFLLFQLIPDRIISVFNADPLLVSLGSRGFRLIALLFFLNGPIVIITTFFQAIGRGGRSFIVLVIHRIVIILPIVYLVSEYSTYTRIWVAFPIATIWAFSIASLLLYRELKKMPRNSIAGATM